MDGFWAFEMERRGAREVVAIDLVDPSRHDARARPLRSGRDGLRAADAARPAVRLEAVGRVRPGHLILLDTVSTVRTTGSVSLRTPPGRLAAANGAVWVTSPEADSLYAIDPARVWPPGTGPCG
jgi:hypothetical protein